MSSHEYSASTHGHVRKVTVTVAVVVVVAGVSCGSHRFTLNVNTILRAHALFFSVLGSCSNSR